MTSKQEQAESGVIIRGAGGGLYYVTETDLQPFRLPDTVSCAVEQALDTDVRGYVLGFQPLVALPGVTVLQVQPEPGPSGGGRRD